MKIICTKAHPSQSESVRDKGSGLFRHTQTHLIYQQCAQLSSRLGAVKNIGIAITQKKGTNLYKLSSLSAGQDKINRYQCRKCQMNIFSFPSVRTISSTHLFKSDRIFMYFTEC